MIIDQEHPFAPYIVLIREGQRVVEPVERVDTRTMRFWEEMDDPSSEGIPCDEIRVLPHIPVHLRALVPQAWKSFDQRD